MATLASLKLVTAKKPTQQPPVVHRRNKLSVKVAEQIALARAQNDGTVFAPTRTKTVLNAEGQKVQITQPKRLKAWWFVKIAGTRVESGPTVISLQHQKSL